MSDRIGEYVCDLYNTDRLTVDYDDDDGRYGFKLVGSSAWLTANGVRTLVSDLTARVGGAPAPAGMTRAEALEKAIAHVTSLTTNTRGYDTVPPGDRASMILRFAEFLLGGK